MTTRHLLTVLTRKALSKKGKRKKSWKSLESCPSSGAVKKKGHLRFTLPQSGFFFFSPSFSAAAFALGRVFNLPLLYVVPFPTIVARGKEEGRPMKISNLEKDPLPSSTPPPLLRRQPCGGVAAWAGLERRKEAERK